MLAIIDYGVGNLNSIKNMLKKAGAKDEVIITSDLKTIERAEKLILPGVGHFDFGMTKLRETGLIPLLDKKVLEDKVPILGICLGAQLMTKRSDEGEVPGLGWVDGETITFNKSKLPIDYKIPHMGWNFVSSEKDVVLMTDMPDESRFYFVHSFHLEMKNPKDVWLTTDYGYNFCAAFHTDNIYACQFHPEKSHKFGMKLLQNFIENVA